MASNPLKIDINDESLKGIFEQNPFYINVKGSINICQIRCGQIFENNNVKLSSMTNFGKVLVLNPNNKEKIEAKIKLAFDSTNDETDENGSSSYTLKKIFFTIPSFHRINGVISDFESYIVYASTQKNGNTLYSVICTLYNGTSQLPTNPHELLTYKFFDELFINNNIIPEKFGTKAIKTPDIIDLTELIPEKGNQSFYEYVNPKNSNVNIRIFQSKMSISNSCIEALKAKLTPGVEYLNFKQNIEQQLNPDKGLFFFYSQDLTNNYKNYINSNKPQEKFSDYEDLIESIEEETSEEEQVVLIQKLKKTHFEKKEKYINFDESISSNQKVYEIDPNSGLIRTLSNDEQTNDSQLIYHNLHDVMNKNPKYDIDEIKKSIEEFPNYVYQNSCWRYDYTIVLYEVKEKLEIENYKITNVYKNNETKEEQTIKEATKKIGLNENKNEDVKKVFYAMKNFPNYEIKNYYISYYYNSKDSKSKFKIIIGVVIFWSILLINYLFYRLVFTIGNSNYIDKKVSDYDILVNDEMKNLAANRLWINILFIIQISCTIIYSLLSISGVISNDVGFSFFIVVLISIIFYMIYSYIVKRFQFTSDQVSYIENHSLKIFLEKDIQINNQSGGGTLENLINTNAKGSSLSIFINNMIDLLSSYSIFSTSFPNKNLMKIQDLFTNLYSKIDNLEDKDKKIELSDQINILKQFIDYSKYDNDSKKNAQDLIQQILNDLPQNKKEGDPLEEIKNNLKDMKTIFLDSSNYKLSVGGNTSSTSSTSSTSNIPIVFSKTNNNNEYGSPIILKDSHYNNDYNSDTIINGKPYFPDLVKPKNEDENKESYNKSKWWPNFWNQTLELKNSLLFLLFIIMILIIIYKLTDIYMLYDMHNKKGWNELSSYNLLNISGSIYFILFIRIIVLFYVGYWLSSILNSISFGYFDIKYDNEFFMELITWNKVSLSIFTIFVLIFIYFIRDYQPIIIFGFIVAFFILFIIINVLSKKFDMNLNRYLKLIFLALIIVSSCYFSIKIIGKTLNTTQKEPLILRITYSVLYCMMIIYGINILYDELKNRENIESTQSTQSTKSTQSKENKNDIPIIIPNNPNQLGGIIKELNEKLTKLGGMLNNKKITKNEIEKNIQSLKQLQEILSNNEKHKIDYEIKNLINNLEDFNDFKL